MTSFQSCYKLQTIFLNSIIRERFSIECRETKPKYLLRPIITNVNSKIDQSELNPEQKQVAGVKRALNLLPREPPLLAPWDVKKRDPGNEVGARGKTLANKSSLVLVLLVTY